MNKEICLDMPNINDDDNCSLFYNDLSEEDEKIYLEQNKVMKNEKEDFECDELFPREDCQDENDFSEFNLSNLINKVKAKKNKKEKGKKSGVQDTNVTLICKFIAGRRKIQKNDVTEP